jgi:spore maturation protein CgeB
VARIEHLPPSDHGTFYNAQRFTLNVTRADMIAAGWSPSVRLFEAAACGTPIISDWWEGLDSLFDPGSEIVIAPDAATVLETLRTLPDRNRQAMARRARDRILSSHTAAHRAMELESYLAEAREVVSL